MVSPSGHQVFTVSAALAQVKAEITEIVTFLRNPRKFLSMGARSPAGILLVGPPGAGCFVLLGAVTAMTPTLLALFQAPSTVPVPAIAQPFHFPAAPVGSGSLTWF